VFSLRTSGIKRRKLNGGMKATVKVILKHTYEEYHNTWICGSGAGG
jgi:hypothetical protein